MTSRWTMDKRDATARRHLFETADLVGAVRLPAGAMRDDAGTDVVVDVLVLRRREIGDSPGETAWLDVADLSDTDEGEGPLSINRYFAENGQQVLGRHGWTSGQFGPEYTCAPNPMLMLDDALPSALSVWPDWHASRCHRRLTSRRCGKADVRMSARQGRGRASRKAAT
ncbi:hypothetical protein [Gluconobacter oxydans]|uniref:hypothetical protein n=1 Tax=Gluconobacter oxydans TaxID=442 RepID=UPI0038D0DBB2